MGEYDKQRNCSKWNGWGKPCRVLRQAFNDNMPAAVISCSLTSGRMRYAPTFFGKQTIICPPPSFPVRSHQGVCDTPLQFLANKLSYACRRHFLFAYVRAYAIRPHNFWRKTKYIMVTLPAYFAIVSGDGSAVANGSI